MGVNTCLWSELEHAAKKTKKKQKKNADFVSCELWVKRVGTFGVVLYHYHDLYILFCILLNCILV